MQSNIAELELENQKYNKEFNAKERRFEKHSSELVATISTTKNKIKDKEKLIESLKANLEEIKEQKMECSAKYKQMMDQSLDKLKQCEENIKMLQFASETQVDFINSLYEKSDSEAEKVAKSQQKLADFLLNIKKEYFS